jgi:class 3 adenylate cyclase
MGNKSLMRYLKIKSLQQAMAKGGEVLLSRSAYAHVAKDVMVRNSFEVQMKGIYETTELYVVEHLRETPG